MHICRFWPCYHYSRSFESLESSDKIAFFAQKPFLIFGAKFENWTIFRRNFWKFQDMGRNWKIPLQSSSNLFIFLTVAKNRLSITSETAALSDPQKNNLKKSYQSHSGFSKTGGARKTAAGKVKIVTKFDESSCRLANQRSLLTPTCVQLPEKIKRIYERKW